MTSSYTTRSATRSTTQQKARIKRYVAFLTCAVVVLGAGVALFVIKPWVNKSIHPVQSVRYLGVYQPDAPGTYAGVDQFAQAIGRQPNLVSYYSRWLEPFQVSFATSAAKHDAKTVVQIDPVNVSLAQIAAGRYDAYLRSYAAAVKAFGAQVVISFGHEMNGNWYPWANQHTSPEVFVDAWRHMVTVFRAAGADNVTWLWTVNIIDSSVPIPNPTPWWPGSSYVNWVGIDGYYYLSSQNFAQVYGPTIVAVLKLTSDPIIIAETGVDPAAGQPAKINDLFSGIRSYGLMGFVWFDENTQGRSWRITSPEAFNALRQDAKAYVRPPATGGAAPTHLPPPPGRSAPLASGPLRPSRIGQALSKGRI
jgi:mannan endo-1,4-beta-mannosidase